jgi:hypothetical protein
MLSFVALARIVTPNVVPDDGVAHALTEGEADFARSQTLLALDGSVSRWPHYARNARPMQKVHQPDGSEPGIHDEFLDWIIPLRTCPRVVQPG